MRKLLAQLLKFSAEESVAFFIDREHATPLVTGVRVFAAFVLPYEPALSANATDKTALKPTVAWR
jgi:hypothetical protein